jgi:hypothetical protein
VWQGISDILWALSRIDHRAGHQFIAGLKLMYYEYEDYQPDFVDLHQKQYGPKAAQPWKMRWSRLCLQTVSILLTHACLLYRCFTTAGIPADDNVSEVWHSDMADGLGKKKLITIGRQLPIMEDYVMGKSLQDQGGCMWHDCL